MSDGQSASPPPQNAPLMHASEESADSAMGAAAVTFTKGRKVFAANAELKISFMAPVTTGSVLTCTAHVVSGGERVAFVEASIEDQDGKLVARASSTYLFRERK